MNIDPDPVVRDALERVTPHPAPTDRWGDVLERAGSRRHHGVVLRWGLSGVVGLAAAALLAVLFLRLGSSDTTGAPTTRTEDATPRVGLPERRIVDGVQLTFSVPAGWETDVNPKISINKSTHGPQDAEAIILFSSFPKGEYAHPCAKLLHPSTTGSSAGALAARVARGPGTRLVTGPADVTVGGRAAKRVVLVVRRNVGCVPGFFYSWRPTIGGAFWPRTSVGDTIQVWIVKMGRTRIFIEAETTKDAGARVGQEIRGIIRSIRFG